MGFGDVRQQRTTDHIHPFRTVGLSLILHRRSPPSRGYKATRDAQTYGGTRAKGPTMGASTIDRQTLANVVQLACRAPSLHNSQPWRLIAEDGQLRVFLEPHRAPQATDRSGREVVISCGALLDHLVVAAAAAGWTAEVAHFPIPMTSTTWPPSTSTAAN